MTLSIIPALIHGSLGNISSMKVTYSRWKPKLAQGSTERNRKCTRPIRTKRCKFWGLQMGHEVPLMPQNVNVSCGYFRPILIAGDRDRRSSETGCLIGCACLLACVCWAATTRWGQWLGIGFRARHPVWGKSIADQTGPKHKFRASVLATGHQHRSDSHSYPGHKP